MTTILLVEDEENYREPLAFNLRGEGFTVLEAADGIQALEQFDPLRIDVVLLDLMLPGLSGMEVCKRIRSQSTVPVIMVTAKDSEIDKIVGLEIGADDYVTKPYSYRELVARVNAVLRRVHPEDPGESSVLEVGSVRMDVERHEVSVRGEMVQMPLREFELLELLMRHPNRVLTRGQIIDRVWGSDYVGDTKTLDVHVKRIRSKIEREPAHPMMLLTVRGLGYKLVDAE
ncbi:response regulator transcription factor [Actinomyces vulturis]|uniref:response regulator transcription factor n=1 Tax=Actinomyces vulturis TaxID=1857645 RepID=UPI00082B8280|nr:response regulator transcription factor [Actinomyces vulturis]